MDKASIIKDAIDYIQELHEQERRIKTEIAELESGNSLEKDTNMIYDFEQQMTIPSSLLRSKKKRSDHHQFYDYGGGGSTTRSFPIEVLEVGHSLSFFFFFFYWTLFQS